MKTAIALPDSLYIETGRLAQRLGKSRSQLYKDALAEYLARHDSEAITQQMNRVCGEVDSRPDPAWSAAAHHVLERSEW